MEPKHLRVTVTDDEGTVLDWCYLTQLKAEERYVHVLLSTRPELVRMPDGTASDNTLTLPVA